MLSSALYRLGRFAAKRPWTIVGSWVVLLVIVIGAANTVGKALEDTFEVPGLDTQQATDLLAGAGSEQAGLTAQVVATPLESGTKFGKSTSSSNELAGLKRSLGELPNVVLVSDPLISADRRVAIVRVHYPLLEELTVTDLENLKAAVEAARSGSQLRIEMGGDLFFAFEEGGSASELVGLVAASLILLLAFGSFIAMGLPIAMALFGLAISISSLSLVTYLVEIPSWAPVIATMVGLGVGIDYSLFLVTRHREYLAAGLSVPDAVGRAVATSGQAVVFAGGVVVVAILGLSVAGIPFLTAAGVAVSIVVLFMVLTSVTLLPALLGLAGHRINRYGIHRRGRLPFSGSSANAGWQRWGGHVTRHAWPYLVGVSAVLVALTAPALAMRVGNPDDGSLPQSRTERQAYDLVAEGFGPGANGPLTIVVDIARDSSRLSAVAGEVASDDGIASVTRPEVDPVAEVATLIATPTTGPQDPATLETIDRLRTDVLPSALGASPTAAHVGGQTANFAEVGDRVSDRLPLFIGAVVLLSFLLLVLVFRSVLVPLKAAVLNLLSIGAAYGVMVLVFQWGWGADLIGLESTVPIISFIPMFMFAILFGLSMDYEVFLLTRVREEFRLSGDNTASVVRGIAGTGRVITCAALIMVSVFLGFVFGSDPTAKMFGLGLATAIFLDATLVRMALVPATMKLLGNANWWLPRWLDRILPDFDSMGETALVDRTLESDLAVSVEVS